MGSFEPGLSRSERVSPRTLSPTSRTLKPGTTWVCSTDSCQAPWSTGGAAGFGGGSDCRLKVSTARSSQDSLLVPLCCADPCCAVNHLRRKREATICCCDCENAPTDYISRICSSLSLR